MYITNISKAIKYRRIILLTICAISLLAAGHLLSAKNTNAEFLVQIVFTITGVIAIYSISPVIVDSRSFKEFFQKLTIRTLSFILALVVFLFYLLFEVNSKPEMDLLAIGVISLIGLLYSIQIPFAGKTIRLKNILVLKNILIGVSWGMLLAYGADGVEKQEVLSLFIFITYQIALGSSIRDMQDIEKDKIIGIKTIPGVLGEIRSIRLYHILNLLSLFAILLCGGEILAGLIIAFVVSWRILNLIMLSTGKSREFWCQTYNILTGSFILLIILLYEYLIWI